MKSPESGFEDTSGGPNGKPPAQSAPQIYSKLAVGENLGTVIGTVYAPVAVYSLSAADRQGTWERFLSDSTPPYKALTPYTARDRSLFQGRQADIERVLRGVGEQQLLVVYGQAWVGKTSLLAAGVIPELMQRGALVVHIQDYLQPVPEALRAALTASDAQVPVTLPEGLGLPGLVHAVVEATKGSLVLVFDQLEQLFEPASAAQQAPLLKDIARALEAENPERLRLILAIREDVLGRLSEWETRLPNLLRASVKVRPLSPEQAREAIENPLAVLRYPVSFVGDLVPARLVPDLGELTADSPSIQPSQLQIVCDWLYEVARERRPPHVDADLYGREGNADGIIARYLGNTLQTRLAGERALAERVLAAMSYPGAGRWVRPEQLSVDSSPPEQVRDVLEGLAEAGLLVPRAVNGHHEYAFASSCLNQYVRQLAGPEVERRYRAEDELDRVWAAWLARGALATRGQVRYLGEAGGHLTPRAVRTLLVLRSAVRQDQPPGPWLSQLRSDEGRALVRQLEGTGTSEDEERVSRSTLDQAETLLGLRDGTLPARPEGASDRQPFGPVAWAAMTHPQPDARQTAALALTVPDPYTALDRLNWALRAGAGRWRRWGRGAEWRGALAEADPDLARHLRASLSPPDRFGVWQWRVRQRLWRDRDRLLWLTLGGAAGAGLGLGLLREAVVRLGKPAIVPPGLEFAVWIYWGALLGALVVLGLLAAEPLRPGQPGVESGQPRGGGALVLATILGAVGFGLAYLLVCLPNGLDPLGEGRIAAMGLLAGLGLSLALQGQPRAGWRLGLGGWALRLAAVALCFVLAQWVFVASPARNDSLVMVWADGSYRSYYTHFAAGWVGALMKQWPRWPGYLSMLNAALAGVVLMLGAMAGLSLGARWLDKWLSLEARARD